MTLRCHIFMHHSTYLHYYISNNTDATFHNSRSTDDTSE